MTDFNDETLPDRRPLILRLVEKRAGIEAKNKFAPIKTLGTPRKGEKWYANAMAMDSCFRNVLSRSLNNQISYDAYSSFIGYGMLSNLTQEALIRAGVETIADDMTRKPPELYYDDDGNGKEDLINTINSEMARYKIKSIINDAMQKDGYFGGCLVYIDVGDLEDDEAEEPLVLDKKTFKSGSFRGLKVIEPVNIAAGDYNTTNPTDKNYFKPEWYYILGKRYHASRFLYIASNDAPLLLKPAYNFFGIPQAQLALDYVANYIANRESAQELLNKFSLTGFGTDLSQALQQDGSWSDIINRIKAFNKFKTNNGTFVYNKETEELMQLNTPLGGVRDIVEMSMNCLTAVWRIPKVRYIGEGDGGLNASTDGQLRSYYDYILALQEKVLITPYEKIIRILQLNKGLEPDDKLLFKFPYLWEMDEKERAELNKTQADRDAVYLANGVISQEEVRQRLSLDRYSGYTMIDVDDVPEPQEQPLENTDKEEQDEEDRQAMDEWVESSVDEKSNDLTEDSSMWSKVKGRLAFDSFKNHHGRVGRVGGSLPKNITEQEINRLTQNAPKEWGEAFVEYTQRPAEAIEKLLKEKRGYVPEAIYKKDVGLIDFVWGKEGEKGTDNGFGISHIIRRRTEHMHDGVQFVRDLPSLIKNGKFYKPKGSNRIFIETKDKKSVISLDWEGNSKVWLLTAYFKDENKMG